MMSLFISFFLKGAFAMAPYQVTCADSLDCPEWVAGLRNSTGVCSAFLVAKDIVGTNMHCIPDDLQKERISCLGKIMVTFPKSGRFEPEYIDCDQIIHLSPPRTDNFLSPDFAFIRLAKPANRTPLDLSQDGIADGSSLTIYKVDPEADGRGTVRKVVCPAVQKSLINPYYVADKSPLVSFVPCSIIKGNSGSAILNKEGKAVGTVFGTSEYRLPISAQLQQAAGSVSSGHGSNFACLNTFFLHYNRGEPSECQIRIDGIGQKQAAEAIVQPKLNELQKNMDAKLSEIFKKIAPITQEKIQWETAQEDVPEAQIQRGVLADAFISPRCLLVGVKKHRSYVASLKEKPLEFQFDWVRIRGKLGHDSAYRPATRIEETKVPVKLSLNPKDLLMVHQIPVKITAVDPVQVTELPQSWKNLKLSLCEATMLEEPR